MCGRYSFAPTPKQRKSLEKQVEVPSDLELRFNIAPTQKAYVITNEAPFHLQKMEWGLIPHWSPDGKNSGKLINARAEGIAEKPSFRKPINSKRCLVPADSFYEWKKLPGGRKIPYRIFQKNETLLFFAGIWDEWGKAGEIKRTFSIITTSPNLEMRDLHNRMPVLLTDEESQQLWLSPIPLNRHLTLLQTPKDGLLSRYPVSEKLNKPESEGAYLQIMVPEALVLF
ncbi:MAG: SOS response-associated peptidase [Saprospiraceae bacterium]